MQSAEGNAVGFLFAYPLQAGTPANNNKILWVVRAPRDGASLTIEGHPLGAAAPIEHEEASPDASPGEIYPSTINMPTPGCWHLTLRWNGNTATLDLPYV